MEQTLKESGENTDFTLTEYYKERIQYHIKMLYYYLNQEK
jgi:hypothetical protein